MYLQAELPPFNVQGAKFVMMQKDFKEYKTPEALLEALPMIAPLDKKIFLTQALNETGERIKGHWKFNPKTLAGVPKLDWNHLDSAGASCARV